MLSRAFLSSKYLRNLRKRRKVLVKTCQRWYTKLSRLYKGGGVNFGTNYRLCLPQENNRQGSRIFCVDFYFFIVVAELFVSVVRITS